MTADKNQVMPCEQFNHAMTCFLFLLPKSAATMAEVPLCKPIPNAKNKAKTMLAIDNPDNATSDICPANQLSVRLYKVLKTIPKAAGIPMRTMCL